MSLKPLLIESWLPIQAIGAESQRERGASSALPPLYFLHVWWARRPLTTSRYFSQCSPPMVCGLSARFARQISQ